VFSCFSSEGQETFSLCLYFSPLSPPTLQNVFEIHSNVQPFLCIRVIKGLELPQCSFPRDVEGQTNKESERLGPLFGVNCILYSLIPERRSFVGPGRAERRAWRRHRTAPRPSRRGEIQRESTRSPDGSSQRVVVAGRVEQMKKANFGRKLLFKLF